MEIFLLTLSQFDVGFDEIYRYVVMASDVKQARRLCSKRAREDYLKKFWIDPKHSTCRRLGTPASFGKRARIISTARTAPPISSVTTYYEYPAVVREGNGWAYPGLRFVRSTPWDGMHFRRRD